MKSVMSPPQLKSGNRFSYLPINHHQEDRGFITTFVSPSKSMYKKAKKAKNPFGIGQLAGNCFIIQIMALYESCVKYEVPYYYLLDIPSLFGGGEDDVPSYDLAAPSLFDDGESELSDDEIVIPGLLGSWGDLVSDDDLGMTYLVGGGEDDEARTPPLKKRRTPGKGRSGQIGRRKKIQEC